MAGLAVTSMSSKGQVVIPDRIRRRMGLQAGAKLVVVCDGENLLFKPVEAPRLAAFRQLVAESRRFARESGLKRQDVAEAIKRVRSAGRG